MSTPRSLPSDFTVAALGPLRAGWVAELPPAPGDATGAPAGAWLLAASDVTEVDAAGVQFLLALSRSLADRRHVLQLLEPSPALVAACRALGVPSLLSATASAEATS